MTRRLWVMLLCGVLVLLIDNGLRLTSLATSGLGFMVGLGLSCTTDVIVLGAIVRVVPNERRGIVFGAVIGACSLGTFSFVPGAKHLLDITRWRETLLIAAFLIALAPLLALGLRVPTSQFDRRQVRRWGIAAMFC